MLKGPSVHPDPDEGNPLVRDSLYSEKVVWSGGPAVIRITSVQRATAWVMAVIAMVSTLLAIAASQAQVPSAGKLVLFSAWCATFALLVRMVPVIWAHAVRFVVTDRHVIWRRGGFKRSMQRDGISYARIVWSRRRPGVGDLELVRAVPTGALRRKLTLALRGVAAPDQLWSIVRGVPTHTFGGRGDRPIAERLDEDEQVLWTGRPARTWREWLPMSTRRTLATAFGLACLFVGIRTIVAAGPMFQKLLVAGVVPTSLAFLALSGAVLLTIVLLLAIAGGLLFLGIPREPFLNRRTMYLVTDRRVLLQRANKEIHLDRTTIVDVADREGLYGGRDVFLVLDGPRARALSAQGAFGPTERARGFLPLLRNVDDVEGLRLALARPSIAPGAEPS